MINVVSDGSVDDVGRLITAKTPAEVVEAVTRELSSQLTPESVDWAFVLAELAVHHGLSLEVIRTCASNMSWKAREIGQRLPSDHDWERCGAAFDPASARRVLAYVHACRIRMDYKFDELARETRRLLSLVPDDAFLHSMAAFAALGQQAARAVPILDRVPTLPDYDSHCRTVCLNGVWFGAHLPDQAERILALSDEIISRGEESANVYYWRALGFRKLERYAEALECVDQAIALLPPGMNLVHQDYVRERELISAAQMFSDRVDALADQLSTQLRDQFQQHRDEMEHEVEQHTRAARRIVSDSLIGIVEVLALFVTLAGFLIGSGALVLRSDSFWQGVAAVSLLLVGALCFFVLLRLVVRIERRTRRGGGAGLARIKFWSMQD